MTSESTTPTKPQQTEQWLLNRMQQAIVTMLKSYAITEPVYGVILTYGTGLGEDLPPWVAVGTQRERQAFLKDAPQEAMDLMWDGEVLEIYDPIEALEDDGEFMDTCAEWSIDAHRSRLVDGSAAASDKLAALMLRLCFSLNDIDWSKIFPTTADFVVTVCTTEGDGLWENMAMLLPPERYDEMAAKGYLPE